MPLRFSLLVLLLLPNVICGDEPAAGEEQIILVGTWTAGTALHVVALDTSDGDLTWLGATTKAGDYIEAMQFIHQDTDNPLLVVANNPCCDTCPDVDACRAGIAGDLDGTITALRMNVSDSIRTVGSMPAFERLDRASALGRGPNALAVDHRDTGDGSRVSATLMVANYYSGDVSMLPIDRSGRFVDRGGAEFVTERTPEAEGRDRVTTPIDPAASLAHDVLVDAMCGDSAPVVVVDAGARAIGWFDFAHPDVSSTAGIGMLDVQNLTDDPRRLVLHPRLPVAYVLYEQINAVGVWRRDVDAEPCGRLTGAELQRVATTPLNATANLSYAWASEMMIVPAGSATTAEQKGEEETDFFLMISNRGTGWHATLPIDSESGHIREPEAEFAASGGPAPREFAIAARGAFLIVADQEQGTLTSFRRNRATGTIASNGTVLAGFELPVSVAVWPGSLPPQKAHR